ncbi:MAG TPA: glycosyltransferase [Thermoanaerobaculia bacterium]|nr:glycosyltransferase [Thermoanaerobaculia bacterium]
MNVLLLASRFPWPAYSGDRVRTTIWLDALAAHARVALVAPEGEVPHTAPSFSFHPARRSLTNGARALRRVARETLPLTTLLTAAYDWAAAIADARRDLGAFDATIVILSRLDPWVRDHLEGRRILDAIDSLGHNTLERSRASSLSSFWQREAKRVQRAEDDAVRAYDEVLVVSEEETSAMRATAIPNGVVITPLDPRRRRYDFAFWGRLSYFANADAARVLIHETWPAIRELAPEATLVLGGSHVPHDIRRDAERAGIALVTPVPDMQTFARDAKIALVPMRFGSGMQTKILEAAEAGCAIAATTHAMRGLAPLARHATLADDTPSLARAAVELLRDERGCVQNGLALRREVQQQFARELTHRRLLALLQRGQAAA